MMVFRIAVWWGGVLAFFRFSHPHTERIHGRRIRTPRSTALHDDPSSAGVFPTKRADWNSKHKHGMSVIAAFIFLPMRNSM